MLRNQASALQQYVELVTEDHSTKSKRTAYKSKEMPEGLNTKSKLAEYLKNTATTNNHPRIGGTRVFTVQDRMKEAENRHHQRLYDWKKLNGRRRRRPKREEPLKEEHEVGQHAPESAHAYAILDTPTTPTTRATRYIQNNPADRMNQTNQTANIKLSDEKDSAAALLVHVPPSPHTPHPPHPPHQAHPPQQSQTVHRLKIFFAGIDQCYAQNHKNTQPVRPHMLKMLRKKSLAAAHHHMPQYQALVPAPRCQSSIAMDQSMLERRIREFNPGKKKKQQNNQRVHRQSSRFTDLAPSHLPHQHYQQSRPPLHPSPCSQLQPCLPQSIVTTCRRPSKRQTQRQTDIIMQNMQLYLRSMPAPQMFENDPEEEDGEDERNATASTRLSGIGNIANVASLVGKFRNKLRRKQLVTRYSTSKEFTNKEFADLQIKSKTFFEDEQFQSARFLSSLIMRWLEKKSCLSAFAQDAMQELIDREDRTALYVLHVYMSDSKMCLRFLRTKKRVDHERSKALVMNDMGKEKKMRGKSKEGRITPKITLSPDVLQAIERLLE